MKLFLGNLQDPSLSPAHDGLTVYPGAFWLEPPWRDVGKFPIEWLVTEAALRDIVLLVHPENIVADAWLTEAFKTLIATLKCKIIT